MLGAGLTDLIAREEALAAEVAKIERQRDDVRAQIIAQEREMLARGAPSPPHSKRPRTVASTPCEPKPWRHLDEVQAEIARKRAAGELLPFGAPDRTPRVCTPSRSPNPACAACVHAYALGRRSRMRARATSTLTRRYDARRHRRLL